MLPKGKLLALVMIFAAIGLITASGAFTTVQADREADVTVAGDSSALLQLEAHNSTNLADEPNDEVRVTLDGDDGLNTNATTAEDRLINISNQGNNAVAISVEANTTNGASAYFYVLNESGAITGAASNGVAHDNDDFPGALNDNRYNISGENSASRVQVNSGETVTVGMRVDTTGMNTTKNAIFVDDDAIIVTAIDTNQTSVDLTSNGNGLGPQQQS